MLYRVNRSADYINSDDRLTFAYYNVSLSYYRKFLNSIFKIELYHSGFLGADNVEGGDQGKNPILFKDLHYIYYPVKNFSLKLGRFYFDIGGSERDYFFSDRIDGLNLQYRVNDSIYIQGLFDILGIASKPEGTRIWYGIEKDDEFIEDFNGDVISLRGGLVGKIYFARVFSFFLRYGANTQGGADIAENGKSIINKADGDYLSMSGARFSFDFGMAGEFDLTGAYSYGKDYQFYDEKIYNGFAFSLNYSKWFQQSILRRISFSSGYFHPGFCSMKAQSMGNTLLWAYKGYFPSPYAYFYHFKDYQKRTFGQTYIDKTIPKTFGRLDIDIKFWKFIISLSSVGLFESAPTLPYMGIENELTVNLIVDNITFSMMGAVFFPSNWYRDRATRLTVNPGSIFEMLYYPDDYLNRIVINTYLPFGKDPFYGFSFSSSYTLTWF